MRDIKRIEEILSLLRALWYTCPDLRLGQLIVILSMTDRIFYVEDTVILERIERVIREGFQAL